MGKPQPGSGSLKRRAASREPKKRFLVVVEGRVTEAEYFRAIRDEIRGELLTVEINSEGGVPKTLVERAVVIKRQAEKRADAMEDDNERFDEIWCVHDVDEHPNILDARQQAQAHAIHLATSNPCFELWALLHFEDLTSYQERSAVRSLLKKHLPTYDKELPFRKLHQATSYFRDSASAYFKAKERAETLERIQESAQQPGGNPSTTVHYLTEQLRALIQRRTR